MYDWQILKQFTRPLSRGRSVVLNEQWPGYDFLKREFGDLFPRSVREYHDDLIVINVGQHGMKFARQCLREA